MDMQPSSSTLPPLGGMLSPPVDPTEGDLQETMKIVKVNDVNDVGVRIDLTTTIATTKGELKQLLRFKRSLHRLKRLS